MRGHAEAAAGPNSWPRPSPIGRAGALTGPMTPSGNAERIKGITQLSITNFHEWREEIRLVLGVMDLDHALREDAPTAPIAGADDATNAAAVKQYEMEKQRWELSNRLSLMIMQNSISIGIRGAIPDSKDNVPFNAKQYITSVEEQFKSSSKAQANALIMRMATVKYNGAGSVREHIMMMVDIAAKLKGIEMEISDGYLVHFIMTSLPPQYNAFKINYNSLKEKWTISELISIHGKRGEPKDKKKLNFKPKKAEFKKAKGESSDAVGSSKGPKCRFCKKHWAHPEGLISGSSEARKINLEESRDYDDTPVIPQDFIYVPQIVVPPTENISAAPTTELNETQNEDNGINNSLPNIEDNTNEPQQPINVAVVNETQQPAVVEGEPLRRSLRERKSAIPSDYVTYISEDMGKADAPTSFKEAILVKTSDNSSKWLAVMKDELKSMSTNDVWDLVEIPDGVKQVGCKWVYKTKYDSKGKVEKFKARLVAKGFVQREGIDYNETFSPVSTKDSFRIVMALVANYNLELHQMDVKTAFLNGDLNENVYITQTEGFVVEGKEHMGCRLKKSIYGLKQSSKQWYLKFDEVIKNFGFAENKVDNCIYIKVKGGKMIILVLYVDDVLLACNDNHMLHETKRFLSSKFDMKDIGKASYVLGIEIHRDRSNGVARGKANVIGNGTGTRFGRN
ncbi:hypothetical protein U9M48_030935 [Paspalum notatum var. saurae]|uniref:Reverse transcriptase Ty1/copia-type domain-containing protein n=1 Tax=Paspalum notatum var. saurae TaxID=547442 RepID=A0AAQ3U6B5_PASNO